MSDANDTPDNDGQQDQGLAYAETVVAMPVAAADGQPPNSPPEQPEDQAISTIRKSATKAAAMPAAGVAEPPPPPNTFSISFSRIHRSAAFIKLGLETPTKNIDIPSARHATYLMLDAKTLNTDKNRKIVRDEVGIIASCRDFEVSEDNSGNLVIVAFSERGGVEKLFNIERSIRKAAPQAKMVLGDCTITKMGETEFTLVDESLDPTADNVLKLDAAEGTTLLTSALSEKIDDPGSRVGSNTKLYKEITTNPKYVRLIEAVSLVSKEQGGPDRLIGYEKEFAALLTYAIDDETGVICLEGAAGIGKSRLRTELLNILPAHIKCSLEASDRNIPGSSLVTLTDQLSTTIKEDEFSKGLQQKEGPVKRTVYEGDLVLTGDQATDKQALTMTEFKGWAHADQIKFAAKHPEAVAELCYNALVELRESKDPKTLFVTEDLHHADRISEAFIVNLVERYGQKGKALVTARPEEMYQSQAFKNLKAQPKVKVVTLKGLELSERDELGHDYAYYSLPPELRENRSIGSWYKLLAGKAKKSPLIMKNFMDETRSYPNLQIIGNTIEVKRECLERIGKINPDSDTDIATYFQERIAALQPKTRRLLQCVALMEERLSHWQTIQLADKVLGINSNELVTMARDLSAGGYLVEDKSQGHSPKLQHEATREIVLSSIENEETKVGLARALYDLFKEEEGLATKTKHALAHVIGKSMPRVVGSDQEIFWQEYSNLTEQLFADAEYHHDAQYGYETATEALKVPALQSCIIALNNGSRVYPGDMETLAIKCLMSKADHARFLGKFDEAEKIISTLKLLHKHLPGDIDILAVHLIEFEKACMESDPQKLEVIYKEIQTCGKPVPKDVQITLDIKLAVFGNRFADAITIYHDNKAFLQEEAAKYEKTHSSPSPVYLDLRRLCETRCPYELLKRREIKIEGHDFDDDVMRQKKAFTAENQGQLEELIGILADIDKIGKSHPMTLNPWSEVKVIEQRGEMLSCLGRYDEALQCLSESWRIAMQIGLYDHAARVAKGKGDTEIMQALTGPSEDRVRLIKKAIETYSTEGITEAASHISEQAVYQFILKVERIRAIGILALEPDAISIQRFPQYVETALADFKALNKTPHWAEAATNPKNRWHSIIHYYLMGYVGHILKIANEQGEDIYDESQYPFMNIGCLEKAIEMGDGMTDLGFGEVERKIDGLHILVQALRSREHMLDKGRRRDREERFRHNAETIEVPRGYIATMEIGIGTREVVIIDPIQKHESGFTESVEYLRELTQEILGGDEQERPTRAEMEINITHAILEFVRINTGFPRIAQDPESLYQVMGYMGNIIQTANREGIQIDNNILNEEQYPYMKLESVSSAYEFGKQVIDLGHKNEVNKKMDGLFSLLTSLRNRQHQQRKQAHQTRDQEFLVRRAA